MRLLYKLLANGIALFHLLWGLWGAIGAVLALNGYYAKHPMAWGIYFVAMVANGLYLKFIAHCPLTVWERKIRVHYDARAKDLDTFSLYYLEKFTGMKTAAPVVWIFIWSIYLCNIIGFIIWR